MEVAVFPIRIDVFVRLAGQGKYVIFVLMDIGEKTVPISVSVTTEVRVIEIMAVYAHQDIMEKK